MGRPCISLTARDEAVFASQMVTGMGAQPEFGPLSCSSSVGIRLTYIVQSELLNVTSHAAYYLPDGKDTKLQRLHTVLAAKEG